MNVVYGDVAQCSSVAECHIWTQPSTSGRIGVPEKRTVATNVVYSNGRLVGTFGVIDVNGGSAKY